MDVEGSGVPPFYILPQNFPVNTEEKNHTSPQSGKMSSGQRFKY
jgi:hypothetical protein